jgi:MYXO-CTERM domain-containing protein
MSAEQCNRDFEGRTFTLHPGLDAGDPELAGMVDAFQSTWMTVIRAQVNGDRLSVDGCLGPVTAGAMRFTLDEYDAGRLPTSLGAVVESVRAWVADLPAPGGVVPEPLPPQPDEPQPAPARGGGGLLLMLAIFALARRRR